MPYNPTPFNYYGTSNSQIKDDLDKANQNFSILAQAFYNNDPSSQPILRASYVGPTAPSNPVAGMTWLNTASNPPVLWAYDGSIWHSNADTVDGFHASQTPSPNTIPVSGSNGKIDIGWLDKSSLLLNSSCNYAEYFVGSNAPSNPKIGDLFFNSTDNNLYRYNGITWEAINWASFIEATPEYRVNRLRVNYNILEISPDGTNWYQCYPLIGATTFNIATIDNQSYTYKYYLPPGATVTIKNANHVPIVYTPTVVPMFSFQGFWTHEFETWVGFRPSNIAISDGVGQYLVGYDSSLIADKITGLSIIPFYEQAAVNENWNHATLTIRENQRWLVLGQNQAGYDYYVVVTCSSGTAPSTSYWLGTWYRQDGVQFTADYVTITRRR